MNQEIAVGPEKGRSRWGLMRERAADFVRRLPDGSNLWGVFFRSKDSTKRNQPWCEQFSRQLAGASDRREMADFIGSFPAPSRRNGTALWDAQGMALEKAEAILRTNPLDYVTVLVYTDGRDQGAGLTNVLGSVKYDEKSVRAMMDRREEQYRNFELVNIYRPGDENILDAHVVRLGKNRFDLPNLVETPEDVIDLLFTFRDTKQVALTGKQLSIEVVPEAGRPAPIEVLPDKMDFRNGTIPVKIQRVEGVKIPPDQEIQVTLRLIYPSIPGVFVVAEGGDKIKLRFQKATAPEISGLLPKSGLQFPVGHEITFSLNTLERAKVIWHLDSGENKEGATVRHAYASPGQRTVKVVVTDPVTKQKATAEIVVDIVEYALALEPPPTGIVPEKLVVLRASASGRFRRYERVVDGATLAGKPRGDGKPGTEIELTFQQAGGHEVKVIGFAQRLQVETKPMKVIVKMVPRLRLVNPSEEQEWYFNKKARFQAELEGLDEDRVVFSVVAEDGSVVVKPREVVASRDGRVMRAVLEFTVPRMPKRCRAKVRVELKLGAETKVPPREVWVNLLDEPAQLAIKSLDGPELHWGRKSGFELDSNVALKDIVWFFEFHNERVADRSGQMLVRRSFAFYGPVKIRVEAKGPDGSPLKAGPLEVVVPLRPVHAKAALIYEGRRIGTDLAKVPVRSTLELRDESTGDILQRRWLYNGKPLPAGQRTIRVDRLGPGEVALEVEGTKQAGSDRSVIAFSTTDRLAFWAVAIGILAIWALLTKLAFGNRARRWIVAVANKQLFGKSTFPRERRLSECGSWNWWKKYATVPLSELDGKGGWSEKHELRISGQREPSVRKQWSTKNPVMPRAPKSPKSDLSRFTWLERPRPKNEQHSKVFVAVSTWGTGVDWITLALQALWLATGIAGAWLLYKLAQFWI